jgi:hypothetical protein
MIAVDTSGVPAYVKWLEAEALRLRLEVRTVYRRWAVAIHAEIAELTPQWSGNLAANWAIDLNAATSSEQFLGSAAKGFLGGFVAGEELFSRGMEPAVSISLARGKSFGLPNLSDSIYIHNPVEYADEVETDSGDRPIRAINRIPRTTTGQIAMVAYAYAKNATNGQALLNELLSRPN